MQGIRNSGSTKAADNRTPEENELIELRKRDRQLEMEVDVSDVLLQCLFDRFGSVFPQCGLMVFPGVVIVSR